MTTDEEMLAIALILAMGPPYRRDNREAVRATMEHSTLASSMREAMVRQLAEDGPESEIGKAVLKLYRSEQ